MAVGWTCASADEREGGKSYCYYYYYYYENACGDSRDTSFTRAGNGSMASDMRRDLVGNVQFALLIVQVRGKPL